VILSLVITIVIEHLFDIGVHFTFLLIQVHDNVVILLFLFSMNGLNLLALLSKLSQLLDLWSQMSLNIFQFLFEIKSEVTVLKRTKTILQSRAEDLGEFMKNLERS
jgi:hypothetical protein